MVASHPVEIGVSHGRRKARCQSKPDQARRRCENSRHSSKLLPSPTPLEAELAGCRLGMIEPQGRGKEYGNRGRDSPGRGGRRRADGGAAGATGRQSPPAGGANCTMQDGPPGSKRGRFDPPQGRGGGGGGGGGGGFDSVRFSFSVHS
jgi:hypothetical protein